MIVRQEQIMLLLGTIFTRQVWCTTVFTVCRILSKKTTVVHHDEETHQPTIEVYGAEAAHTVLVNRLFVGFGLFIQFVENKKINITSSSVAVLSLLVFHYLSTVQNLVLKHRQSPAESTSIKSGQVVLIHKTGHLSVFYNSMSVFWSATLRFRYDCV